MIKKPEPNLDPKNVEAEYQQAIIQVGIDPGTVTGLAFADDKGNLLKVQSFPILRAMEEIVNYTQTPETWSHQMLFYIEDPTQRRHFGNTGRERLQGAGSIKRDFSIWLEFFQRQNFTFVAVPPRNNTTKLNATQFWKITGWKERSNEHGRDAAMLIFKRKAPKPKKP